MSLYPRYFEPGQLQFLTTSTYRRNPLFACDRFRWYFVDVLRELRPEMGFLLLGWVLMPEHFHLLIKPEPAEQTSVFMQELKKRTAQRIIASLSGQSRHPWCRSALARLRLPPTVHNDSRYRVWQRRFVPFNVYTEKKRLQKLDYMHHNPVRRGLVDSPDQWPWSSFRFYYLNDSSVLVMDHLNLTATIRPVAVGTAVPLPPAQTRAGGLTHTVLTSDGVTYGGEAYYRPRAHAPAH